MLVTLKIVLEVLKFSAIIIGAISGVLGTLTETKDKPSDEVKRSKRKIVALILLSAVVAVGTQSVESYLKWKTDSEENTKRAAEENTIQNILQGTHDNLSKADALRTDFDTKSRSLLDTQKQTGDRIASKLDDSASILRQGVVSHLSEVRAFELDFFMGGIGAELPDFFKLFANEPVEKADDDFRMAVLRSVFCSSPRSVRSAVFTVPLSQDPKLDLSVIAKDARAGACPLSVSLEIYPTEEGSARSQAVDFKWADPTMPASPQIRGDRAIFYIQVSSRHLSALKQDEVLRFDSFALQSEPSLYVLCSRPEDSAEVVEHFKRVLPRIIGFNIIPNLTQKNFQTSSEFQLVANPDVAPNGILFFFKKTKKGSKWNANQFLAGTD
jgi:hypothetical protein